MSSRPAADTCRPQLAHLHPSSPSTSPGLEFSPVPPRSVGYRTFKNVLTGQKGLGGSVFGTRRPLQLHFPQDFNETHTPPPGGRGGVRSQAGGALDWEQSQTGLLRRSLWLRFPDPQIRSCCRPASLSRCPGIHPSSPSSPVT